MTNIKVTNMKEIQQGNLLGVPPFTENSVTGVFEMAPKGSNYDYFNGYYLFFKSVFGFSVWAPRRTFSKDPKSSFTHLRRFWAP